MKTFPKIAIILALLAAMLFIVRWACAETKVGLDLGYGTDTVLPSGYQSDKCTNTVTRISARYETNSLIIISDNLWLGVEGVWSKHKAHSKVRLGFDAGFRDLGANLTVRYDVLGPVYIGGFAGLSVSLGRDHGVDDLANSGLLGHFGVMTGVDIPVYKRYFIRLEGRVSHTSDPLRSTDAGKEYGSIIGGITYTF